MVLSDTRTRQGTWEDYTRRVEATRTGSAVDAVLNQVEKRCCMLARPEAEETGGAAAEPDMSTAEELPAGKSKSPSERGTTCADLDVAWGV